MTTTDVLIIFLSALGIFFTVRQVTQWTINSLLYGRLNKAYLKYTHDRLAQKANRAFEKDDGECAWDEVANAKLKELGAHRYDARERALDYLENVQPTKKLAARLAEVLPRQHRLAVQARMACFLCKTLEAILQREDTADESPRRLETLSTSSKKLQVWGSVLSIWITEIVCSAAIWNRLDQLPMGLVVLVGIIAFCAAFLPLTVTVHGWASLINSMFVIAAVVSGGLWGYTEQNHAGLNTISCPLDGYGLDGLNVQIDYPKWLTVDDIGCCEKPIVVIVSDDSLPVTSFETEAEKVYTKDENCKWSHPVISTTTPSSQPFVFFVTPKGRHALVKGTTIITPQIHSPIQGEPPTPITDLSFTISLENPTWKIFRDICKAITGGTTLLALVSFTMNRVLKKE